MSLTEEITPHVRFCLFQRDTYVSPFILHSRLRGTVQASIMLILIFYNKWPNVRAFRNLVREKKGNARDN
jgi:hypothetical protein